MRYLLILVFLGIFIPFLQNAKCQEVQQSGWFPIIILKYGFVFGSTSGDFFDTYNRPGSFPRPLLISEARWEDYKEPNRHSTLGAEVGAKIRDKFSVGLSGQRYGFDKTDDLDYRGFFIETSTGDVIEFPSVNEQHHFKGSITHVLAFLDYRVFAKSSLSPVVGLGLGFTFSSFEWNWRINGSTIYNNTFVRLSDDQTFMEIDSERNFAVQPRFRLDYAFSGSGFFHSVFLQTDYIFSKYDADYFEKFRRLVFEGQPFESLPQEFQTDAIKKLYDRYDVSVGGFQLMIGLTLKFDPPESAEE